MPESFCMYSTKNIVSSQEVWVNKSRLRTGTDAGASVSCGGSGGGLGVVSGGVKGLSPINEPRARAGGDAVWNHVGAAISVRAGMSASRIAHFLFCSYLCVLFHVYFLHTLWQNAN